MVTRALTLAAGLMGGAGLSQFPEFSQQYVQRLGGAVDELALQVDRHEAKAAALGMDVTAWLEALAAEGPLAQDEARSIAGDIARHDRLSASLARLQGAGPFSRAQLALSDIRDGDIAKRALEQFRPALPASFEGASFAGVGFVAGWLGLGSVFWFLSRCWGTCRLMLRPRRRV